MLVRAAAVAAAAVFVSTAAMAQVLSAFGTHVTESRDLAAFAQWRDVLHWTDRHLAEIRAGRSPAWRINERRWWALLASLRGQDPRRQVDAVNRFVNAMPHVSDLANYGVDDYWATPRELFLRGGDCEDFAIAKYVSLRELGWPASRLQMIVLEDRRGGVEHAALLVQLDNETLVLDNRSDSTDLARFAWRYRPVYSISELAWWRHDRPSPQAPALTAGR